MYQTIWVACLLRPGLDPWYAIYKKPRWRSDFHFNEYIEDGFSKVPKWKQIMWPVYEWKQLEFSLWSKPWPFLSVLLNLQKLKHDTSRQAAEEMRTHL